MVNEWYSVIALIIFCILVNIPFGMYRATCRKFSLAWFVAVHAPVPLVITLRLLLGTKTIFIPIFIIASVVGQFIGGRIQKYRLSRQNS